MRRVKRLYYASFLPGLERPQERMLAKTGGVSVERMLPGGVLFRSNRSPKLDFVRQCFLVLFQMKPASAPDEAVKRLLSAGEWLNALPFEDIQGKRFRITVSDGTRKLPAGMRYIHLLEETVRTHVGLYTDRERPDLEFWVLLRKEAAYFLLKTEGAPHPEGRMRPDVAGVIAMQFGYDPGAAALFGSADPLLIRMLRDRGCRRITLVCGAGRAPQEAPGTGVRVAGGTAEHSDLPAESQDSVCICLTGKDSEATDLRASLHEAARVMKKDAVLVWLLPLRTRKRLPRGTEN